MLLKNKKKREERKKEKKRNSNEKELITRNLFIYSLPMFIPFVL